ncbi:unnamed protein product, partial [Agarophyton chilense]
SRHDALPRAADAEQQLVPACRVPQPWPRNLLHAPVAYVFYVASYGQFNNQLVSLVNAIYFARSLRAALVLPYTTLGKESSADARLGHRSVGRVMNHQLVRDYFNYSRLLRSYPVLRPDQFFASRSGAELLARPNVTVSHRAGNYYRSLFRIATNSDKSPVLVITHRPPTPMPKPRYCLHDAQQEFRRHNNWGYDPKFALLPIIFFRHNLNCTSTHSDWISIRRHIIPNDAFLRAVERFLHTVQQPVLSIHLRLFLNGDVPNTSAEAIVDSFFRRFASQLSDVNTVFLAYSPSSQMSVQVFNLLGRRFHGAVVDGSTFKDFFETDTVHAAQLPLAPVLFDMWVCVRSRYFVGRLGSSLSWNVAMWRMALWEQYGLRRAVVDSPLWYALEHFSTTGVSRNEGHLYGTTA